MAPEIVLLLWLGDLGWLILSMGPSLALFFLRWTSSTLLGITPILLLGREMKEGVGVGMGGGGRDLATILLCVPGKAVHTLFHHLNSTQWLELSSET